MLWRIVGRWALIAIAIPVAAVVLRKISESVERRHGPTRVTALLRRGASTLESLTGRTRRGAITARR
jgi:hypothetical protein